MRWWNRGDINKIMKLNTKLDEVKSDWIWIKQDEII